MAATAKSRQSHITHGSHRRPDHQCHVLYDLDKTILGFPNDAQKLGPVAGRRRHVTLEASNSADFIVLDANPLDNLPTRGAFGRCICAARLCIAQPVP